MDAGHSNPGDVHVLFYAEVSEAGKASDEHREGDFDLYGDIPGAIRDPE